MAEYSSSPLWDYEHSGYFEFQELSLSKKMTDTLKTWNDLYFSHLDLETGLTSWTEKQRNDFDYQGFILWKELRKELVDTAEVVYFSYIFNKIFFNPDEYSAEFKQYKIDI